MTDAARASAASGITRREALQQLGGSLGLAGVLAGIGPVTGVEPETTPTASQSPHVFNRDPLETEAFAMLPAGSVAPRGWLRQQLTRMAEGMAGHLHEMYPNVGKTNAWRGGNGDVWERGPYWLDGAVPLAYVLDDERLKEAVRPYLEWTLQSQRPDGYFGPPPDKSYVDRDGFQTDRPGDWWPRMVMLKVLQVHHSATGDERVPELMSNYFRYQREMLPEKPLNHWSWWSKMRGGENQASVYWLYNRTGRSDLLDLAQTLFEQTFDWTGRFESQKGNWHVVNTAMGLKQPALQYLLTGKERYLEAVDAGFQYLRRDHRQPQGMFSGDELLHGTDPVHGTELCGVVELMYTLEMLTGITGRVDLADRLERVAYNALPAQHTDDYMGRQYYQQVNQIQASDVPRAASPFSTNHSGTEHCFGLLNGYPCCTTNMHQGWPKFVRSMWRATPDAGLAALCYGPCEVTAQVGDGTEVTIEEETDYPFSDEIHLTVQVDGPTHFPLHLRVPTWTGEATIEVNGRPQARPERGTMAEVDRQWSSGDEVRLHLPAPVQAPQGHERSVSLQRGPLVFARPIEGERESINERHGVPTYAVRPTEDWNHGLEIDPDAPEEAVSIRRSAADDYPWEAAAAPMQLEVPGRKIPAWKEYNGHAGPLPQSPVRPDTDEEPLTLVPYGATTLRVSAFPVVRS